MLTRRTLLAQSAATLGTVIGSPAMASLPNDFYVPAEEAPHAFTLMQWPVDRYAYDSTAHLAEVQTTIARIANAIAQFEPVVMLADQRQHTKARKSLSENVDLWDIPTDDLWCRDSGPLFVVNGRGDRAISHIHFNGWGRYRLPNDEKIAARVADHMGVPLYDAGLVGEPGGAEADGKGLVMAHESSWINANRNPGMSKAEVTDRLAAAYGADRVIWGPGVKGRDVTDAHIDGFARFTETGTVLMQHDDTAPDDPYNRATAILMETLRAQNIDFETIPYAFDGRISDICYYVNYYVCNGAVIMSEFGDTRADAIAKDAVSRHYPGRQIVTLNADALIPLGGGIHCATQQVPAV
ncbi:MAG: agmatine deiminase family protein [Pseudomonadota bacterium]